MPVCFLKDGLLAAGAAIYLNRQIVLVEAFCEGDIMLPILRWPCLWVDACVELLAGSRELDGIQVTNVFEDAVEQL